MLTNLRIFLLIFCIFSLQILATSNIQDENIESETFDNWFGRDKSDTNTYQICKKINIASNADKYTDDMVSEGKTTSKWLTNSVTPIIIGPTKKIDYIYVIVNDYEEKLTRENFRLHYDNVRYANSSMKIDPSRSKVKSNQFYYAVVINYHCNDFGGAFVRYKLEVIIPNCGKAYVAWDKLCGNPLLPRDGLAIDLEDSSLKRNRTIVKDGNIVNASYFDADLDNFVFRVPETTNITSFYIYMEDFTVGGIKNEKGSMKELEDTLDANDPILSALRSMIKDDLSTKIEKIKVDSDETIVRPTIETNLVEKKDVTIRPQEVSIVYNCQGRKAEATIELNIQLENFKDITLFFVKVCDGALDDFTTKKSIFKSFVYLVILMGFIGCMATIIYNIFVKRLTGKHAVPFLEDFIVLLEKYKILKSEEKKGYTSAENFQDSALISEENDKKTEMISFANNKNYGSIGDNL